MTEIETICPKCGWKPDGRAHWRCECGHSWNTFETKGRCPACGKQWADTWCPRCNMSSPHENWYQSKDIILRSPLKNEAELLSRKVKVEEKLFQYGITNFKITYLPYLDFSEEDFQPAYEVGCRILVLWAVSYLANNPSETTDVAEWLIDTALWQKVSEREKKLFSGAPTQQMLDEFSWRIEGMFVLCWAMNLMEQLPDLDQGVSKAIWDEVHEALPLFQDPRDFLKTLTYRNKEEIFIENIINEYITAYLRDKFLIGEENDLTIDGGVAHERHLALNWLRCFSGFSEWDETDTST